MRYFPNQIQNDASHVCGEYSVLFLHKIARSPDPWRNAYEFWTGNQDVFFLLPTNRGGVAADNNEMCVACCNTDKTTKENKRSSHGDKKTKYQNDRLLENDVLVRDIFSKVYNIYLPSSQL